MSVVVALQLFVYRSFGGVSEGAAIGQCSVCVHAHLCMSVCLYGHEHVCAGGCCYARINGVCCPLWHCPHIQVWWH